MHSKASLVSLISIVKVRGQPSDACHRFLTGAGLGLAPHKGKAQSKDTVFHVPGVFVRASCSKSRKYLMLSAIGCAAPQY